MRENCFVNPPKSKLIWFPILIDLTMTGHKLQSIMKTKIDHFFFELWNCKLDLCCAIKGYFHKRPLFSSVIKINFNPKQSKSLLQELQMQQKMEYETLLNLQKNGNFPADFDLEMLICDNDPTTTEQPQKSKRQRVEKPINITATKKTNFDMWCSTKKRKEFHIL
jgi:hypothetical protein